eukprot:gene15452-21538_t
MVHDHQNPNSVVRTQEDNTLVESNNVTRSSHIGETLSYIGGSDTALERDGSSHQRLRLDVPASHLLISKPTLKPRHPVHLQQSVEELESSQLVNRLLERSTLYQLIGDDEELKAELERHGLGVWLPCSDLLISGAAGRGQKENKELYSSSLWNERLGFTDVDALPSTSDPEEAQSNKRWQNEKDRKGAAQALVPPMDSVVLDYPKLARVEVAIAPKIRPTEEPDAPFSEALSSAEGRELACKIVEANSWLELSALVHSHIDAFDHIHLSASFVRLAELSPSNRKHSSLIPGILKLLITLTNQLPVHLDRIGSRQTSDILWAYGSMLPYSSDRMQAQSPDAFSSCACSKGAVTMLPDMPGPCTCPDHGGLSSDQVELRMRDVQLVLVDRMQLFWDEACPQTLSNAIWAMARLDVDPTTAWMHSFLKSSMRLLNPGSGKSADTSPQQGGMLQASTVEQGSNLSASRLSENSSVGPTNSASGGGSTLSWMQFGEKELSSTLWALSKMKFCPGKDWAAAFFSALHETFLSTQLGGPGSQPSELHGPSVSLPQAPLPSQHGFVPPPSTCSISNMLRMSTSLLMKPGEHFTESWYATLTTRLPNLDAGELAAAIKSIAKAHRKDLLHGVVPRELLLACTKRMEELMVIGAATKAAGPAEQAGITGKTLAPDEAPEASTDAQRQRAFMHSLVDFVWSLAVLGHTPPSTWSARLLQRMQNCSEKLHTSPASFSHFMWALASHNVTIPQEWLDKVLSLATKNGLPSRMKLEQLAGTLHALGRLKRTAAPAFVISSLRASTELLKGANPAVLAQLSQACATLSFRPHKEWMTRFIVIAWKLRGDMQATHAARLVASIRDFHFPSLHARNSLASALLSRALPEAAEKLHWNSELVSEAVLAVAHWGWKPRPDFVYRLGAIIMLFQFFLVPDSLSTHVAHGLILPPHFPLPQSCNKPAHMSAGAACRFLAATAELDLWPNGALIHHLIRYATRQIKSLKNEDISLLIRAVTQFEAKGLLANYPLPPEMVNKNKRGSSSAAQLTFSFILPQLDSCPIRSLINLGSCMRAGKHLPPVQWCKAYEDATGKYMSSKSIPASERVALLGIMLDFRHLPSPPWMKKWYKHTGATARSLKPKDLYVALALAVQVEKVSQTLSAAHIVKNAKMKTPPLKWISALEQAAADSAASTAEVELSRWWSPADIMLLSAHLHDARHGTLDDVQAESGLLHPVLETRLASLIRPAGLSASTEIGRQKLQNIAILQTLNSLSLLPPPAFCGPLVSGAVPLLHHHLLLQPFPDVFDIVWQLGAQHIRHTHSSEPVSSAAQVSATEPLQHVYDFLGFGSKLDAAASYSWIACQGAGVTAKVSFEPQELALQPVELLLSTLQSLAVWRHKPPVEWLNSYMQMLVSHAHALTGQDVSRVLHLLAMMGAKPSEEHVQALLDGHPGSIYATCSPRQQHDLLLALCVFKHDPGAKWWGRFERSLLSPQAVPNHTRQKLSDRSVSNLEAMGPPKVAALICVFAKMQHRPSGPCMACLLTTATASLPELSPNDLAELLQSLSVLEEVPSIAWMDLFFAESEARMDDFSVHNLVSIAGGLAHLRRKPRQEWVHAFLQRSADLVPECWGPQIVVILASLAALDCHPPLPWLTMFVEAAQRRAHELDPLAHSNLSWALQRLGMDRNGLAEVEPTEELQHPYVSMASGLMASMAAKHALQQGSRSTSPHKKSNQAKMTPQSRVSVRRRSLQVSTS